MPSMVAFAPLERESELYVPGPVFSDVLPARFMLEPELWKRRCALLAWNIPFGTSLSTPSNLGEYLPGPGQTALIAISASGLCLLVELKAADFILLAC